MATRTTARKPQDPKVFPMPLGTSGMWTSGEPTSIPDGYVRMLRNMLIRPNRIATRPPFVYDNLMAISGLMRWEDLANQQTRFLALDTSRNLYMKAASGETWSAAITGTLTASRITDFANYRGKVYYMLDDGAGNPVAAAVFDGTTISAAPFNSAIFAKTVTTFIDRLILGAPRVTITSVQAAAPTTSYDWTLGSYWVASNLNRATSVLASGVKCCRLSPTSLAVSACSIMYSDPSVPPTRGAIQVTASTIERKYTWRSDLGGVDPLYEAPFTMEWVLIAGRQNNTAYALGDMIVISTSPAALTATIAAGAGVTAGTHSYKVSFVTATGETPAGAASNQVTTAAGNLQVNLTGIPIGDGSVTARRIYRTVAGDTGNYLLQQTISDNTTTTATDNTPDGSLVNVTAPSTGTAIEENCRYRCTVAGTSAAVAPQFTKLGTVIDGGTLTWTNEGSDVLQALESYVPNASTDQRFATNYLTATVPARTNTVYVTYRLKLYNSSSPALSVLAPVDVSLSDGLADGDPRKANFGQQFTAGDFFFPFINTETATSATVNLSSWIWTETSQPKVIRAANTEEPQEAAGLPTAACVLSGRFIGFKRRAFWVFKGSADPDNPLLPESPATMTDGCLGPRAVAVVDDEAFFIGENDVYRFRVGGYPQGLCGDAMMETIMDRGADWVENQATYNMPLIAIDRKYGEVWVYTQKGKLFCYHLPETSAPSAASALFQQSGKGAWTTIDVGDGFEIAAMAFNPITQEMEFSIGGHGLARLDPNVTAQDTIDNTATLYPVTKDIILKPFELYSPRYELCLHEIGIYHLASYTQAGEALWAYVSFDRGATYPKFNEVRFDPANPRIPISIFQAGLSVQLKLSHIGSAGEAAWCVSRGESTMELMSGEWPLSRPTQIASSL